MKKDVYNLSKPQESIWLTEQYFKDTNINRIITLADFSSKIDNIDFELLNAAINHTVRQNDNFQIRLFLENGNVKQYFEEFVPFKCEFNEISSLEEFIDEDAKRENVFNLLENPLYEFRLFRIKGTNTGGILANFHHIICDGFSTAICIRQIAEIYNAFINNLDLPLIDTEAFSYKNYLASEKDYIGSSKFEKDRDYWLTKYETVPELATIRGTKSSSNDLVCSAERSTFVMDVTLMEKINAFCNELNISLYNFFMAVFSIYISKATRLNSFAIGTPILNRTNFKEKNTSGMYISTVPFRIDIENDMSFLDFISLIQKDTMAMLRHQKFSYQYILDELKKMDASISKLYDIAFSYQITKASDAMSNYSTEWLFNYCSNDDLAIHIYDINDNNTVSISYDYKVDSHSKDEIECIHPRILKIVNQVLENKNISTKDIEIITDKERNLILNEFNNTSTAYPKNASIISLFEEQVKLYPNDPAIFFEGSSLSYSELNMKANSLACFLKDSKNIKPKDIIGLLFDKSFEEIIAILAVLKLGAIYVPIDVSYPKDRISYMIKDSNAKLVLTTSNVDVSSLPSNCNNIFIDLKCDFYQNGFSFDSIKNAELVSIIYTSGSTGLPKGVLLGNKGVIRLVRNTNHINFSRGNRVLHSASIAFDVSSFEIWGALLNGLELFLIRKNDLLDVKEFEKFLKENNITMMLSTTAFVNKICETDPYIFSNLKHLTIGGEVASLKHAKMALSVNPNLVFENAYGPTENAVVSSYFEVSTDTMDFIPIGRPISNSTCYIVSKDGMLLPPFVPGELWVGGDGVAFGYINRNELTNQKFINNPFGERKNL